MVDHVTDTWRKVNPAKERANHQAILINNKYIIDSANNFIFQIQSDGQLTLLNIENFASPKIYSEENIDVVARILKKYYTYKELGITSVYNYF